MKTARSATVSATLTDCSTTITVVPRAWISRTFSMSSPTTTGERPSDSSSIISSGAGEERLRQAELLLLAARQIAGPASVGPLAQDREDLEHLGQRQRLRRRRRHQPRAEQQVLAHGQAGEDAAPAGHLHDAAGDLVRRHVGDVATVEHDGAARRLLGAADGAQQRRLAGAVGAEERDDLALLDVEVDAEQHLHAVVVHVHVAADQQLCVAASLRLPPRLGGDRRWRRALRMSSSKKLDALMKRRAPMMANGIENTHTMRRTWSATKSRVIGRPNPDVGSAARAPNSCRPWVRMLAGRTWE